MVRELSVGISEDTGWKLLFATFMGLQLYQPPFDDNDISTNISAVDVRKVMSKAMAV